MGVSGVFERPEGATQAEATEPMERGARHRGASPRRRDRRGGTAPTWPGVRLVAGLELRQRVRTTRWYVVLGVWMLAVYGMVALTWLAMSGLSDGVERGVTLHSMTTFVVLGFGLLVVPALTATSINGERERGVLATLQVTQLSAADLVLGKLLAAWALAGAFLLAAAPVYLFALVSGASAVRVAVTLLVLAVVLAVFCAIGLAFSALTARTVSSVVLTYLAVVVLALVDALVFGLLYPQVTVDEPRQVYAAPSGMATDASACKVVERTDAVAHTERIWWLLALNPFVVVADATPPNPPDARATFFDPLEAIATGTRLAKQGPAPGVVNDCYLVDGGTATVADQAPTPEQWAAQASPVWPFGLVGLTLLGAGSAWIAVRRTTTPVHRLPRDVRIA